MQTRRPPMTRRRFVGFTAATAGGLLLPIAMGRAADPIGAPSTDAYERIGV